MSTLKFYAERAADCRRQAEVTNLTNVRARCLNAASAWDDMADRVRRTQVYREEDAARKMGGNPAPPNECSAAASRPDPGTT